MFLFDVSGLFLIPGKRKSFRVPPMRVLARDLSHAAKEVAPILGKQCGATLSPDFVRMNVRIEKHGQRERVLAAVKAGFEA